VRGKGGKGAEVSVSPHLTHMSRTAVTMADARGGAAAGAAALDHRAFLLHIDDQPAEHTHTHTPQQNVTHEEAPAQEAEGAPQVPTHHLVQQQQQREGVKLRERKRRRLFFFEALRVATRMRSKKSKAAKKGI
jgi:hypothetical protein